MLIAKTLLRLDSNLECIIEICVNPLLQCCGSSRYVYTDLSFEGLIEWFQLAEYELSSEGHVDVFPVENFRIIV
jgi:hypothetical protein